MRISQFFALLLLAPLALAQAHEGHDHSHDHDHDHSHDQAAVNAPITVENAWARETPPGGKVSAAYMTITGLAADRLVKASGEVAQTIELHTHLLEDGVMKMREISGIDVNPGEPAVLRPGGLHIMLIDLVEPLKTDDSFFLTLHFEKAGELTFEIPVKRGPSAAMPMPHAH